MNQAFLKYKRMGVKTDVDYRAFISRFKDDHNPDIKDYKYDAEDRKDENWRSYNRVVVDRLMAITNVVYFKGCSLRK